jgi:hypothetical protein
MKKILALLLALSACQTLPPSSPTGNTSVAALPRETTPLTDMAVPSASPVSVLTASAQAPTVAKNIPQPAAPARSEKLPIAAVPTAVSSKPAVSPVVNSKTRIPIASLNVPKGFDYATTQDIQVDIQVKSPNGNPYQKVMVAIYAVDSQGFNPLVRGVTDAEGRYQDLMRIPGYHQALQIQVSALGIENYQQVKIVNDQLIAQFGN